tara:strand:+ start:185 stop:382 length:198 start_codon:yes stop_codon:yes gene_type:complete
MDTVTLVNQISLEDNTMPNKQAKHRKRQRRLKNKELNKDGRTSKQVERNKIKIERKRKARELGDI